MWNRGGGTRAASFDVPCGDWTQSSEPDPSALLVSGTELPKAPQQFSFTPSFIHAEASPQPAPTEPNVMLPLFVTAGVIMIGIAFAAGWWFTRRLRRAP